MVELTACRVDLARGVVRRDGAEVELTTREADLLRYLVANPSRRVTRDELLANVWHYADAVVSRACDNTVRRLREKIEAEPARPDHVLTIHGAGYRFVGPDREPLPVPLAATRVVIVGQVRVDLDRLQLRAGDADPVTIGQAEAAVLEALVRAGA
ncbi:MAG: winged helix-turn-helix domain-containing protein, partial [Myxococcota bacterium]